MARARWSPEHHHGWLAGDRPAERGNPVRVDDQTSSRTLVLRTMWGANRYVIPAMVLMILHFAGEAMVPMIMGLAIDRAVLRQDSGELWIWLAVLAADFFVLSVTWRFGNRMAQYAVAVIEHQFRMRLTDRMLHPDGTDGPARLPGTALSIATSDVARISRAILLAIFPVGEMFAVLVAGVVLLWISWPLGVAVLVGAPLMFWLLDRAGAPLRARTEVQQESVGLAAGAAADLVSGFRVLKGIGAEDEAAERYRTASATARDAAIAASRSEGGYIGLLQVVGALFVVAVGLAAGLLAVDGQLGLGELITVVGLTQFILGPINAVGTNFGAVWNGALPSATRILSVLQAGPAVVGGRLRDADGPLVIDGVSGAADRRVTIAPRGLTVIVSDRQATGQLTGVLARSIDRGSLTVTIGDTDHSQLDYAAARRAVRVVPHAPHLFEGSVLDNVRAVVGDVAEGDQAAEHRVTAAVFAAACDDVAQVLPAGLDTPVGEAGNMLSGGQRQRVALARALAAQSDYLVLIDPTTAVDSITEATVVDRVKPARADAATVVFTSSPAWIAAADQVITLASTEIEVGGSVASAEALR